MYVVSLNVVNGTSFMSFNWTSSKSNGSLLVF